MNQLKRRIILAVCFLITSCFILPFYAEAKKANEIKDVEVKVTAYYTPKKGQKKYANGTYKKDKKINGSQEKTSSGTIPKSGTIAADPEIFPEGTILYIPGYGMGKVEDTGQDIKGYRIDVYTGSGDNGRLWAQEWGIRRLRVMVIPSA